MCNQTTSCMLCGMTQLLVIQLHASCIKLCFTLLNYSIALKYHCTLAAPSCRRESILFLWNQCIQVNALLEGKQLLAACSFLAKNSCWYNGDNTIHSTKITHCQVIHTYGCYWCHMPSKLMNIDETTHVPDDACAVTRACYNHIVSWRRSQAGDRICVTIQRLF